MSKKPKKKASRRDAQGRTHLVVHRDGQGRVQRLSLSKPLFSEAWQNDIAAAAAGTAHGILSQGRTPENAVELGRSAMAGTSKMVAGLLARSSQAPACKTGCAHCCYQAVGVSAPEVLAIYDHLESTRSPEELARTVQRIRDADDETRGMSSADRFSPDLPCPFLENERCSIYDARPLACRGKNSLDAEACEQTLREPAARNELLAGTRKVPCFLEPIRTFHAVAAGVQLALAELHRLDVAPLELTAAMRILVDDPVGVATAWLAGRDPFHAARGGDSSSDPLARELSGKK